MLNKMSNMSTLADAATTEASTKTARRAPDTEKAAKAETQKKTEQKTEKQPEKQTVKEPLSFGA